MQDQAKERACMPLYMYNRPMVICASQRNTVCIICMVHATNGSLFLPPPTHNVARICHS